MVDGTFHARVNHDTSPQSSFFGSKLKFPCSRAGSTVDRQATVQQQLPSCPGLSVLPCLGVPNFQLPSMHACQCDDFASQVHNLPRIITYYLTFHITTVPTIMPYRSTVLRCIVSTLSLQRTRCCNALSISAVLGHCRTKQCSIPHLTWRYRGLRSLTDMASV